MTLAGTRTHENLIEAFSRESMANRRFLYFARVARAEGLEAIAELFEETANGETGHAFGHLDLLERGAAGDPATGEPIGGTEANLASALAGETHGSTVLYPGFARTAREEGLDEIADWMATLARAERTHAGRFAAALSSLRSGASPAPEA